MIDMKKKKRQFHIYDYIKKSIEVEIKRFGKIEQRKR